MEKKVTKDMFEKIMSGEKKFEIRLANEDYNKGDILILKEVDENGDFTGRELIKEIGFVLETKKLPYWSEEDKNKFGFAVMQLK